jgi:hypothetical protein
MARRRRSLIGGKPGIRPSAGGGEAGDDLDEGDAEGGEGTPAPAPVAAPPPVVATEPAPVAPSSASHPADAPTSPMPDAPAAPRPVARQVVGEEDAFDLIDPHARPRVERSGATIVPADASELAAALDDDDATPLSESELPAYAEVPTVMTAVSSTPPPAAASAPPKAAASPPTVERSGQTIGEGWAVEVDVNDGGYVETGRFAEDSTDHGWQDAVYGSPATQNSEIEDFNAASGGDPLGTGFLDLADGAEPPTEEAPGGVFEDLSHVYGAPMSVPEPPAIPGIVDRYTPPPLTRRSPVPANEKRPAFTPTAPPRIPPGPGPASSPPSAPPPSTPPPPELRRRQRRPAEEAAPPPAEDPRTMVLFGFLGAAVLIAILFVVFVLYGMLFRAPETEAPVVQDPDVGRVEVTPVVDPALAPDPSAPTPVPVRSTLQGTPPPEPVVEAPAPAPTRPSPAPATRPAPTTRPGPAPAARPAPAAPAPAATNGTLSIQSNRRVIVSINGRAVDFTPLEISVPAGAYTISAALPSRADSSQTREVRLDAGDRETITFTF